VWALDAKRNVMLLMKGYFFGINNATTQCTRSDAGVVDGDLRFDLSTRTWLPADWPAQPLGPGGDASGPTHGVYDAPTDSLYAYRKDGSWGGNMLILQRATNTWTRVLLGQRATTDERLRNAACIRSQPALDPGKALYMACRSSGKGVLVKFDLVTRKGSLIAMPTGYLTSSEYTETLMAFDPVARVVLHPVIPQLDGLVAQFHVYAVDTGTWETRPVPALTPPVQGNLSAFDTRQGAFILYGGHGTATLPQPNGLWLYKYGRTP
jgi:hypothetical protein